MTPTSISSKAFEVIYKKDIWKMKVENSKSKKNAKMTNRQKDKETFHHIF